MSIYWLIRRYIMWGEGWELAVFKARASVFKNLYEKNAAAPWNLRTKSGYT
jgi:hypothetical protein